MSADRPMLPRLLDTNVLLRYLAHDDKERAQHALHLLQRIERADERVVVSPMVIFETAFTLRSRYKVARQDVRNMLRPIIELPGLQLSEKAVYLRALDLLAEHGVSFADAFNVAFMEARGLDEVYTWDADFDRFPGISRVDPASAGDGTTSNGPRADSDH